MTSYCSLQQITLQFTRNKTDDKQMANERALIKAFLRSKTMIFKLNMIIIDLYNNLIIPYLSIVLDISAVLSYNKAERQFYNNNIMSQIYREWHLEQIL